MPHGTCQFTMTGIHRHVTQLFLLSSSHRRGCYSIHRPSSLRTHDIPDIHSGTSRDGLSLSVQSRLLATSHSRRHSVSNVTTNRVWNVNRALFLAYFTFGTMVVPRVVFGCVPNQFSVPAATSLVLSTMWMTFCLAISGMEA